MCEAIVTGKVKEAYDPAGMHNPEPLGSFADLNKANWAHYVADVNGQYIESVSDLDCLIIWMFQHELKNPDNKNSSTTINLMDMDIDLETMKVKFLTDGKHYSSSKEYVLTKDANNQRCRCHDSVKGFNEQFDIK